MRNPDTTTVSPDVLLEIARLTALQVPGVHSLSSVRHSAHGSHKDEGVQIEIADGVVDVDLFLVFESDVNLRQSSRAVQTSVARAISDMVGMQAGRINIHIDDIYFPPAA